VHRSVSDHFRDNRGCADYLNISIGVMPGKDRSSTPGPDGDARPKPVSDGMASISKGRVGSRLPDEPTERLGFKVV
jgi:hypothetical protein